MNRRTCKASTVVEMAYLMPVVLLCWMFVIFALFYYHDKSVMAGVAYEAAVVGAELWTEEDENRSVITEDYFRKRIDGKLLFYRTVEVRVQIEQKEVQVEASAVKYRMILYVEERVAITEPEKKVRDMAILKETVEGVTK